MFSAVVKNANGSATTVSETMKGVNKKGYADDGRDNGSFWERLTGQK